MFSSSNPVYLSATLITQNVPFICMAVNAIFGRIGRIASEEVIIQLIKSKCISILIYGLEVCPLTKSDLKSLDFPVNRFFMKLFKTSNIQMVNDCQV